MRKITIMLLTITAMLLMISCNGMIVPSESGTEDQFSGRWTTGIVIQEEVSLIPSVYYHGEKTDFEFLEDGQLEITITYWIRLKHQSENDWVSDESKKTVKEKFIKQIKYQNSEEWHIYLYEQKASSPKEIIKWKLENNEVKISSTTRGEMYIKKVTV